MRRLSKRLQVSIAKSAEATRKAVDSSRALVKERHRSKKLGADRADLIALKGELARKENELHRAIRKAERSLDDGVEPAED